MLLSDLDIVLLSVIDQIVSTTAWFPLLHCSVMMLFPVTEIFLWFSWKRKTNGTGYKRYFSSTPDTIYLCWNYPIYRTFFIIQGRNEHKHKYGNYLLAYTRYQWPRGLRRRSAGSRLLRLWVRITPGTWMFFCCVCLYCQVEVSATSWSLVQRSPTDCGASLCVI
jgi:hypothetical protein